MFEIALVQVQEGLGRGDDRLQAAGDRRAQKCIIYQYISQPFPKPVRNVFTLLCTKEFDLPVARGKGKRGSIVAIKGWTITECEWRCVVCGHPPRNIQAFYEQQMATPRTPLATAFALT